jgi:integrase
VAECPLDEMNRPRASVEPQLRVPPSATEVDRLFAGWREELATCRKFAPAARNKTTAARLEADIGLRVNEVRMLDLDDVRWDLGQFGKLNVRHGKGARRKGPKPRLVPLINGADHNLRWFIEDVWGQFGDDHERPGAPLFPSERKARDGPPRGRPTTCSAGRWPRPPSISLLVSSVPVWSVAHHGGQSGCRAPKTVIMSRPSGLHQPL